VSIDFESVRQGFAGKRPSLHGCPGDRGQGNIETYPKIVDRNNSKKAADVESAKVGGRAARINQYAADQKSGEYEEQIHAGPTCTGGALYVKWQAVVRGESAPVGIVIKNDKKNGDAAKSIQFRDPDLLSHVSMLRRDSACVKREGHWLHGASRK